MQEAFKNLFCSEMPNLFVFLTILPQRKEVESQRLRGEEMDAMLIERDRKLTEKEAYIVHLQTALSGDQSFTPAPAPAQVSGWTQHLQHYTEKMMSI